MLTRINPKCAYIFFVALLALALVSTAAVKEAHAENPTWIAGPWVIYGGVTNVIVMVETESGVDDDFNHRHIHFDYPDGCNEPNWGYDYEDIVIINGIDNRLWKIWANNLSPGCKYDYTFKFRRLKVSSWGEVSGTFTTGPGSGDVPEVADFFAFGDQKYIGGANQDNIEAVAVTMMLDGGATTGKPLVNTGDMAYKGGYGVNEEDYWTGFFQTNIQDLYAANIILPTPGNHDVQTSGGYNTGDATNYTRFFPYNAGNATVSDPRLVYYHKVYRPFHFFSLTSEPMDTDDYCSVTNQNYRPSSQGGTGQYEWIEQQLSESDDTETPWKIVFMHAPIYSPEDCYEQEDARTYLVPLFEKYDVDIFFSGHEHYYARKTVNGIPYLILGGGGAGLSLNNTGCETDPQSCRGFDFVANKHHYADIFTRGDVMTVAVRDENNDALETFTVDRTPRPDFDAESGKPAGASIKFTDTSSGHRYKYEWDFGDGSPHDTGTGRDASTEHVYASEGTYTVILTITSAYQSVTKTCTACVIIGPKADFDANPIEGPYPLTVAFEDLSEGAVGSWLWNFGDGNTSDEQNPVHTYNEHGRYTVSLSVANNGVSDTKTVHDYVKVEPYAEFNYKTIQECTLPIPLNGCLLWDYPTSFTNASGGSSLTYQWDFGDDHTSGEENPSYTYDYLGYRAKLTVTDEDGRTDYMTQYIEDISIPEPPETVDIDIMPWRKTNKILMRHDHIVLPKTIRVAILSIDDAPASGLDPNTLTFGRTGDEASLTKIENRKRDVNGDGHMDFLCSFKPKKTGFQAGDFEGVLRGKTTDGRLLEGRDSIQVISVKGKHGP